MKKMSKWLHEKISKRNDYKKNHWLQKKNVLIEMIARKKCLNEMITRRKIWKKWLQEMQLITRKNFLKEKMITRIIEHHSDIKRKMTILAKYCTENWSELIWEKHNIYLHNYVGTNKSRWIHRNYLEQEQTEQRPTIPNKQ